MGTSGAFIIRVPQVNQDRHEPPLAVDYGAEGPATGNPSNQVDNFVIRFTAHVQFLESGFWCAAAAITTAAAAILPSPRSAQATSPAPVPSPTPCHCALLCGIALCCVTRPIHQHVTDTLSADCALDDVDVGGAHPSHV